MMPILGLGLHVIVAIYFAIHAVRTHQGLYWLFILFMFPLLGSIVYLFAIYMPELRHSRSGTAAKRAINKLVDPHRALREARQAFELTPTLDRRLKLANALEDNGAISEALSHYEEAGTGPFARDVAVLTGQARCYVALDRFDDAARSLNTLFDVRPEARRDAVISLLHARTQAALGHADTRNAFETALTHASGPAAACHYADWLSRQGLADDLSRARALYESVVADSRHWNNHARSLHKGWLSHAEQALARLPA